MTKITLFRSAGHITGFEAKGHTGLADAGEDIVCAAVSALTQTAVMGLRELLKLVPAVEIKEAYLYCMLPDSLPPEQQHDAELILGTMAMGLGSIAQTNGDYIKLTDREV